MGVKKYNRGELYWHVNPNQSKDDYLKDGKNQEFLDNRPVLIVSSYIDEYGSSVYGVPTTTSPNRSGIDITIEKEGGETSKTKLLPQRMWPVPIKNLKGYIGRIDDDTLNEVMKSIQFHLGISDEEPEYVKEDKIKMDIRKSIVTHDIPEAEDLSIDEIDKFIINESLLKDAKKVVGKTVIGYDARIYEYIFSHLKPHVKLMSAFKNMRSVDRFLVLTKQCSIVSEALHLNSKQTSMLRRLVAMQFVLIQNQLLKDLGSHSIELTSMKSLEKIVFITISDDELRKVIKKESLISMYKRSFRKEMKL